MKSLEYKFSEDGHKYKELWKGTCTGTFTIIDSNRRKISVDQQRCGLGYEGSHIDSTGYVFPIDNTWPSSSFGPIERTLTGRTLTCDETTLTASEDNPGPNSLTITFKREKKVP